MHPGAATPMHAWGSQTPMHPGATPLHVPATPSWDPTRCVARFGSLPCGWGLAMRPLLHSLSSRARSG